MYRLFSSVVKDTVFYSFGAALVLATVNVYGFVRWFSS